VTLTEVQCPSVVTAVGATVTAKFKAERPLAGEKMVLALVFPVGQGGVSYMRSYFYKGEQPTSPSPTHSGHYTMSSDDQGILTLRLAPPHIQGPPSQFGLREIFVLSGKRTISMRLDRCLVQTCRETQPASNPLTFEVEFR
jgi:hypothetical protein